MLTMQIPVVRTDGAGTLYNGPAGALPGSGAGLYACLGCAITQQPGVNLSFGNGVAWSITVQDANVITRVTDTGGLKSATYNASSLAGKWIFAELVVPANNSEVRCYVNGALVASTPMVSAVVPSAGAPQVNGGSDGGSVFCAGYKGAAPASAAVQFGLYAALVAGNGGVAPAALADLDNFWCTRFYNDGAHPPVAVPQSPAAIWLPQKGAISLAQAPGAQSVATYSLPWF